MSRAHHATAARHAALAALLAATPAAWAQSPEVTPPSDAERPRVITVDAAVRPGEGRVPVRIEATRTPHLELSLAEEPPRAVRRDATFATERVPALCRAPCTLYLRPGPQRLIGDASSDFPWAADVRVPAAGALAVRLRGHLLGLSALGGAAFILGLAGAVGGPAVIIVSAIVGDPRAPLPLVIGGSIGAVIGGLLIWGGYSLIGFAGPRVESSVARPNPPAARPPAPAASAWRVAPVPTRDGALLVGSVAF